MNPSLLEKPCRKCGQVDRNAWGACQVCARDWHSKNKKRFVSAKLFSTPCKCGVLDRLPNGRCRPCNRKHPAEYVRSPDNKEKKRVRDQRRHERRMRSPEERAKMRAAALKRNYNITPEEYDALFQKQGGVCAICGQPETAMDKRLGRQRNLHVDHDHETGKVRALLCSNCNQGLGHFKDSLRLLAAAFFYLEQHGKTLESEGIRDVEVHPCPERL
jgi:hypothetical protein